MKRRQRRGHGGGCWGAAEVGAPQGRLNFLSAAKMFGTAAGARSHPFGGKTDWNILHELLEGQGYAADALGTLMELYQACMPRHLAAIIGNDPVEVCAGAPALLATLRGRTDIVWGLVMGNVAATVPVKLRSWGFDPAWCCASAGHALPGGPSPARPATRHSAV